MKEDAMPRRNHPRSGVVATAFLAAATLAGCIGETLNRGYVASDTAIQQVQVGAPREQVLIALGAPSTTADFGGEVFYYISQKTSRPVAFLNSHVVDQKVLAVYFDENEQVRQVANYGLEEGRIVDFVSRTTPTSGRDFSFLSQLFAAAGNPAAGGSLAGSPGR
jgi:outer membrane protein assembly factor BamE (lipoprotein component of BamABCDE complex)